MGKLSMSLALVALLAVAGTYAARPIDVSNEESIKPMNTLEEQVVSDSSRELLSMHYPPPPPLADFQGNENRPTIVQEITVPFNNSELATNFTNAVGGSIRCPQEGECSQDSSRKLLANHLTPVNFATDYLEKMLDASEDGDGVTAEDGVITVSDADGSITMSTTLYYPDGTTQGQLDDETTDDLASRDVTSWDDSQLSAFAAEYGINIDSVQEFKNLATDTESFTPTEDPSSGAEGLKASLFMGVAVILSAFLLA